MRNIYNQENLWHIRELIAAKAFQVKNKITNKDTIVFKDLAEVRSFINDRKSGIIFDYEDKKTILIDVNSYNEHEQIKTMNQEIKNFILKPFLQDADHTVIVVQNQEPSKIAKLLRIGVDKKSCAVETQTETFYFETCSRMHLFDPEDMVQRFGYHNKNSSICIY
jgi:lipopolysaccharide export LptBFGC system permease protein LptF